MTITPIFDKARMQYETPREGITIGGYVARRLHKTRLLKPVADLLKQDSARALAQIALYATAASTSFGPAMYQPDWDPAGKVIQTVDPETGARVTVTCEGDLRFSYRIEMPNVGVLSGVETITGTTVGLRGLGMPAPTTFKFEAEQSDYRADINGSLDLSDNQGNHGKLTLDRSGAVIVSLTAYDGKTLALKERLI